MGNELYSFATKDLINNKKKVEFLYREKSDKENDSGWRFFSGEETQEYVDNPDNILMCSIKDILQIDPSIEKVLDSEPGSAFERSKDNDEFKRIEDFKFGENLP